MSWIAEDLVSVLRDIPSTCGADVSIYITGEEGDPLQAVRTMPQAEPTSPDIEKHPRAESQSLSIKSAGARGKKMGGKVALDEDRQSVESSVKNPVLSLIFSPSTTRSLLPLAN